jgi:Chaperone of endosialidase
MSSVNLPASLYDMFQSINDRINRLELGYNGPQASADAAQATATGAQSSANTAYTQAINAQSDANSALAQANIAYGQAISSLKPSAYVISNATQQITSIATNGVTVYSGSSSSSGARVTMNSLGLAGYDSSGNPTFSISASTGAAYFSGSITGSTITGSELNIGGNFYVQGTTGLLSARNVTLSGNITATSGSFSGSIYSVQGTIGGFTIGPTYLSGSGYFFLDSSTGDATFNSVKLGYSGVYNFSSAGALSASSVTTSGALSVGTSAFISSSAEVGGNFQVDTLGSVTYSSTNYNIGLFGTGNGGTQAGRMYKTTSVSSKRFKHNIQPFIQRDYLDIVSKLNPVTFNYNADVVDNPEVTAYGLIAEDVQEIPQTEDLVIIGADGLPESIAYDRLQWYVIKSISQINDRLTKLEGK